jgi:MSHA biogenesis protein MshN
LILSLINQVLKDIDKRQTKAAGLSAIDDENVRHSQARPDSRRPLLLALVAVLLIAVAGYLYRDLLPWAKKTRPEPLVAAPVVVAPLPIQKIEPAPAPAAAPAAAPAPPKATIAAPTPTPAPVKAPPQQEPPPPVAVITKVETPEQRSLTLFQQAQRQIQQGQLIEARATLQQSLKLQQEHHAARLLLARLMLELRDPNEAEQVLEEGLRRTPAHHGLLMTLAHVRVQNNNVPGAISALQKEEASARNNAEYQALLASLLQRTNDHASASRHYLAALRLTPDNAPWLLGLAISLQAQNMRVAALEAYARALDLGTLPPVLADVARQRIAQLNRDNSP